MTYDQIKKELKEQGLKDEFCSLFESFLSEKFLKMIKNTDSLKSTASLLRALIRRLEYKSEVYNRWVKIFHFYITPKFARPLTITEYLKNY